MSMNDLIDICGYQSSSIKGEETDINNVEPRQFKAIGLSGGESQNGEVDLTMHVQRLTLQEAFKRFLGYEDENNLYDCFIENEATLDVIERYFVDQIPVKFKDDLTMINYTSEGLDSNVCVRLSKLLTWYYLGYNPRLYKHYQIVEVYKALRNTLDVYKNDPTSLVTIEIPDEIKSNMVSLMERLESNFKEVIHPTIESIDKPITTFLESKFAGLFGNDRQVTIRSDNKVVKNGFVLNEEDQDLLEQFEDSLLTYENKWE